LHLKIVNDRNIVTMYYSADGQAWTRHGVRSETSGYHANTVDDLLSCGPRCLPRQGRRAFPGFSLPRLA
jgi:xylan 1,4-beta-xylosidase